MISNVILILKRSYAVNNNLKFKVDNQTLPFDSLGLTKAELKDIKSFLVALTDATDLNSVPEKLPQVNDEKLNARKIGGEY